MKVSHADLQKMVAEVGGMDILQADKYLREWADQIQKEAAEKGYCEIPDLGTFAFEDDELRFAPDKTLALEVNHKYAGLKPIDIQPASARKLDYKLEKPEPSEDPAEAQKKPDPMPGEAEDIPEEPPVKETIEEDEKTEADHLPEADPGTAVDHEVEPVAEPDAKPAADLEVEPAIEHDTKPATEPGEKPEEKELEQPSVKDDTPKAWKKPEKESPILWHWLLPAAAVVILAVLLFFHFDGLRMDRDLSERPVTEPALPVAPEPEVAEVRPVEPDPPSPYGLTGPAEELLHGSYTIVLHSIANERRARIEKDRFEEQGYKATLWQARLPDGTRTWRIGVGQFESVDQAQASLSELPEPYRSNNFIIRIR